MNDSRTDLDTDNYCADAYDRHIDDVMTGHADPVPGEERFTPKKLTRKERETHALISGLWGRGSKNYHGRRATHLSQQRRFFYEWYRMYRSHRGMATEQKAPTFAPGAKARLCYMRRGAIS